MTKPDLKDFQWTRPPQNYTVTEDKVTMTTEPGTDLWQKTYYHFVNDNAPLFQMRTEEPYFSFTVKTNFEDSHHRFDQCGLILYQDSENWIKGSIEYENDNFQHLGSVVTNHGYSDWATTEISTDMDGTFLNSQNDYDRLRFKKIFEEMQASGARFVAISGNQYHQIRSFFKDVEDQMTIVGDNGAYIVEKGVLLKAFTISTDVIHQVIAFVEKEIPQAQLLLSGEKSAYVKTSMPQADKDYFKIYYHQFKEVPSFETLPDDNFLKLSINIPPKKTDTINAYFNKAFPGQITGTSSGNGNIDLIATGVHKGAAFGYLLAKWGLSTDQLATFGDGGNDIEMLAMTDYSYAMANGSDKVKAVANFQALSNDQSGVLTVIEDLLRK